jgi:hypothetical protein
VAPSGLLLGALDCDDIYFPSHRDLPHSCEITYPRESDISGCRAATYWTGFRKAIGRRLADEFVIDRQVKTGSGTPLKTFEPCLALLDLVVGHGAASGSLRSKCRVGTAGGAGTGGSLSNPAALSNIAAAGEAIEQHGADELPICPTDRVLVDAAE